MAVVRLDQDGNLAPGFVSGNRPGDIAARNSRRGDPVSASEPKTIVTVTTDGTHVAVSVGAQKPAHFENKQPAVANKPRITSREMIGGQYAESEIAGRADLQKALPPEQMDFLRNMARGGHAIVIEHAESATAPAVTPRGGAATTRQK